MFALGRVGLFDVGLEFSISRKSNKFLVGALHYTLVNYIAHCTPISLSTVYATLVRLEPTKAIICMSAFVARISTDITARKGLLLKVHNCNMLL